jgi:hypothetical protein
MHNVVIIRFLLRRISIDSYCPEKWFSVCELEMIWSHNLTFTIFKISFLNSILNYYTLILQGDFTVIIPYIRTVYLEPSLLHSHFSSSSSPSFKECLVGFIIWSSYVFPSFLHLSVLSFPPPPSYWLPLRVSHIQSCPIIIIIIIIIIILGLDNPTFKN